MLPCSSGRQPGSGGCVAGDASCQMGGHEARVCAPLCRQCEASAVCSGGLASKDALLCSPNCLAEQLGEEDAR